MMGKEKCGITTVCVDKCKIRNCSYEYDGETFVGHLPEEILGYLSWTAIQMAPAHSAYVAFPFVMVAAS